METVDLLEFQRGRSRWERDRDSVAFTGEGVNGPVEFLITSEALAEMLNPDLGHLDAEMAVAAFEEFEVDIHRIAQREFRRQKDGSRPILLTMADVAGGDAFVSFEFTPSFGQQIPSWGWKEGAWRARISIADLARFHGAVGDAKPDEILALHRVALETAASRKLAHCGDDPVTITMRDLQN